MRDRELWHIVVFALLWNATWWVLVSRFWGHLGTLVLLGLVFAGGSVLLARMVSHMSQTR